MTAAPPPPANEPPAPAASTAATPAATPTKPSATSPAPAQPGTTPNPALAGLLVLDKPAVWYRRPWVWLSAAGLVLAAGGGWWWYQRDLALAAPRYTTSAALRGDITLTVSANGTLQPTRTISIGSELSGTVLQVNVDVNDKVRKGQVMVVLDTAKLRDQILRSKATLAAAVALVAQNRATVNEASAQLARLEEVAQLSGGKVPAKTELGTARATLERAQADLQSAQAGVADSKAAVSTDEITLSKASIAAPADGVVLTRTVEPGNAVAASLQAVTLFTMAEDLAKLRLWLYVDEADVGSVKLGQQATFTVSAYPSRQFPAQITRVGFGSTITDNVVTYLTYLDVANPDLSLRPGMTATAAITAMQRKDVLLVPNAALRFTPSSAADAAKKSAASGLSFGPPKTEHSRKGAADSASTAAARQVWVLQTSGKSGNQSGGIDANQAASGSSIASSSAEGLAGTPVAVAVMPGISDGHMTEITSGDLKAGMLVITAQKTAAK